jgi:hypothetical protein
VARFSGVRHIGSHIGPHPGALTNQRPGPSALPTSPDRVTPGPLFGVPVDGRPGNRLMDTRCLTRPVRRQAGSGPATCRAGGLDKTKANVVVPGEPSTQPFLLHEPNCAQWKGQGRMGRMARQVRSARFVHVALAAGSQHGWDGRRRDPQNRPRDQIHVRTKARSRCRC